MTEQYLIDYMYVFVFLALGAIAAAAPLIISNLIGPRTIQKKTLETYECGMDPYGRAWDIRFNIAYYLYALIFLAFDVDILYLFPVATAFDKVSGVRGVVELVLFIAILSMAIIYAWVKGVFSWAKKKKAY